MFLMALMSQKSWVNAVDLAIFGHIWPYLEYLHQGILQLRDFLLGRI